MTEDESIRNVINLIDKEIGVLKINLLENYIEAVKNGDEVRIKALEQNKKLFEMCLGIGNE